MDDIKVTLTPPPSPRELLALITDLQTRVRALEDGPGPTTDPAESRMGPFQKHSATSRKAAQENEPRTGSQKRLVLDYLLEQGDRGATRQEIALATGLGDDTVRPRVVDLMDGGWVAATNFTRPTPKGGDAEVVIATVIARREATLKTEQTRHTVSPEPVAREPETGALFELPAPRSSHYGDEAA